MPKQKLQGSKDRKNDEFYTLLPDIENEVKKYWDQLEGKKIWCNCDDPEWSNFNKYFEAQKHYHKFEVKYTCYNLVPKNKNGFHKKVIEQSLFDRTDDDKIINTNKIWVDEYGFCEGDFRSPKQDKLWKWADVIITNPPFSLFREFVDKLIREKKFFLIIGPQNAITYKDTFMHIKNNKLWLGYNHHLTGFMKIGSNGKREFLDAKKPNGSVPRCCTWYTNLDTEIRHNTIYLSEWDSKKYVKYENFDAYEIFHEYGIIKKSGRTEYPLTKEVLGVPITFLQKYNPEQFNIIGKSPDDFKPTKLINCIQLSGKFKGSEFINCCYTGTVFYKPKYDKDATFKNKKTGELYFAPFTRLFIQLKDSYYQKLHGGK